MPLYKNLPHSNKKKPDEFVSLVDHSIRYFSSNKRPILVVLGLVIVAGLLVLFMNQKKSSDLNKISELFFQAEGKADPKPTYQEIVKKYSSYPVAEMAQVLLASEEVRQDKIDEAQSALKTSVDKLPSVFGSVALWGEAQLLWQQGKNDEVLALLSSSGPRGEEGLLGNYFRYLRGEILEAAGKTAEAKALYEKLSESGGEDSDVYLQKLVRNRLLLLKT